MENTWLSANLILKNINLSEKEETLLRQKKTRFKIVFIFIIIQFLCLYKIHTIKVLYIYEKYFVKISSHFLLIFPFEVSREFSCNVIMRSAKKFRNFRIAIRKTAITKNSGSASDTVAFHVYRYQHLQERLRDFLDRFSLSLSLCLCHNVSGSRWICKTVEISLARSLSFPPSTYADKFGRFASPCP